MTGTDRHSVDEAVAGLIDVAALAASPVHGPGRRLRWTTANVDEALPGILTPMTWSMYYPPTETTMRDCWVDLGVVPESERPIPDEVDGRFFATAYGHSIVNVDRTGQMAARLPGGTSAAIEELLFGSVLGGGPPDPKGLAKLRRYPIVAAKLPIALRRAMKAHPRMAAETDRWWRRSVFDIDLRPADAARTLVAARAHFVRVLTNHMILTMTGQGVFAQVEVAASRAGQPGLGNEVVKSDGGTSEFELVRDLWRLSKGTLQMEPFLRAHGYHGPREGLLESVIWREDPSPVIELAAAYRSRRGLDDVEGLMVRRAGEQRAAMAKLESGLGSVGGRLARLLVGFASNVPEWRETGRAGILKSVDVARHAHRVLGRDLAERGLLDDPEHVRFLTIDEVEEFDRGLLDGQAIPGLVAQRQRDHAAFEQMDLPHVWRGVPDVTVRRSVGPSGAAAEVTELTGLAVSAGVAEGVVRVVLDLDAADFWETDEPTVMVCKATDPSWASVFPLAEAVVTDVGSQMSHAAIVCRELGLPCVANTRTGTQQLRDGMRVRVDGNTGVVTVLTH